MKADRTKLTGRRSAAHAFSPQPVRAPADQVRLSILEAIISGQLRPGDRLPSELEQARGFKVSRTAVREALRSLAQLDLVSTVQGRGGGSFVNRLESAPVERSLKEAMELLLHFDAINLAELIEARRALEGTCASLGALRRTDKELATVADILERARDSTIGPDAWLQLDIRFHRAVARSAHNRALIVPLAALHAVVQPRLNQSVLPLLDRTQVNSQHHAIYLAIRARQADAAAAAVHRHVTYLERLYRRSGLLDDLPATRSRTLRD